MSRCEPPSPPLDLAALDADLDPDATMFIRISGARSRRTPALDSPTTPARNPPPPPSSTGAPPPPRPAWRARSARSCVPSSPPATPTAPARSGLGVASVAASTSASGRASPFRVPPSMPATAARSAVAEPRLYAVLAVWCLMVCAALALVWAVGTGPEPRVSAEASAAGWMPSAAAEGAAADDTGAWLVEDDADVGSPTALQPTPVVSTAAVVAEPSDAGRASLAASGGTLTIRLPDPRGITSVAVTCPSGFAGRSTYGATVHVIEGVPGESCTLWFRGSSPYRFLGAVGGQSLTCSVRGPVIDCL